MSELNLNDLIEALKDASWSHVAGRLDFKENVSYIAYVDKYKFTLEYCVPMGPFEGHTGLKAEDEAGNEVGEWTERTWHGPLWKILEEIERHRQQVDRREHDSRTQVFRDFILGRIKK